MTKASDIINSKETNERLTRVVNEALNNAYPYIVITVKVNTLAEEKYARRNPTEIAIDTFDDHEDALKHGGRKKKLIGILISAKGASKKEYEDFLPDNAVIEEDIVWTTKQDIVAYRLIRAFLYKRPHVFEK